MYQGVFPENGQSPVSQVSSEGRGSPPNSHGGHRMRAKTELKNLDPFPRDRQRAKIKGYNGILSNGYWKPTEITLTDVELKF